MEVLRLSPCSWLHISATHDRNHLRKSCIEFTPKPTSLFSSVPQPTKKLTLSPFLTPAASTEPANPVGAEELGEERFDWYRQWYPITPVSDLDKRVPHAKRVIGLDVVVWWDRNDKAWKVFDDTCPHRLAPLSEGRIDQWGRLQCVYHGWCFNGSGDCKFIPQAPPDGPPIHNSKKACVAVYPSTVQNSIVWFWPDSDPQFKDILMKQKPPYIPEFDDPIYTESMNNRDLPYGYEVLIENFMDPAHSPYAHYGILPQPKYREGGRPLDLSVTKLDINGFDGKQEWGTNKFIAPCIFCAFPGIPSQGKGSPSPSGDSKKSVQVPQRRAILIFFCVPVSPGKSRLIWTFPRNFGSWINRIVPRWVFHLRQNLVLDSDLYLLHLEERKLLNRGLSNWQKTCFLPAKSDALVIAFRTWLSKYSGGQVDWRGKFAGPLPQTPPRDLLFDRYWSHVVNCCSCSAAAKAFNAIEIVLQVISMASIAVLAVTKQGVLSVGARTALAAMAIICFAASRWLSHFAYKNFRVHDYNHALV